MTPRFAVVPMGWTHALNVCQDIFSSIIKEGLGSDTVLLNDNLPAPSLDSPVVSVYVDNFGVLCTNPTKVRDSVEKVRDMCVRRGLEFHEYVESREGFEFLGMEGTGSGLISVKGKRRRKLYQAMCYAIRRRVMTSRQLEKLVGHFVSQGLLRRESLALLRAVYTFIHRKFKRSAGLWDSVLRELTWMKAILRILEVNIAREWSTKLWAFDASPWGEGITFSYRDVKEIHDIGKYSKRWRFKNSDPPARIGAHNQTQLRV